MAPGLIALVAALAVAVADRACLAADQRPDPRYPRQPGWRRGAQAADGAAADTGPVLTGAELGLPLGQRATLVQFSTAFCAPCRATRRILAEVAGMVDGVAHVEIDAESHLDLVRRLDIRRTPTVLVVGPDGRDRQARERSASQGRRYRRRRGVVVGLFLVIRSKEGDSDR